MESTEMAMPAGTPNIARRRAGRLAGGAAALVAALGAAAAFGVTPAHAAVTANDTTVGVYTINNTASGMVADDFNNQTSWLTPVDAWPSNNGENQKWRFVEVYPDVNPDLSVANPQGGKTAYAHAYQIQNEPYSSGSPTCLEAEGDPTAGDVIEIYGCNPNAIDQPNQLWYPVTINGQTQLINGSSVAQSNEFSYQNGTIYWQQPQAQGVSPLVLTPVGWDSGSIQGNQLVLEPSDSGAYGNYQDWTINPTEYAVNTPNVTVKGDGTISSYTYGCLEGWQPQGYWVAGVIWDITYRADTQYSNLYTSVGEDDSNTADIDVTYDNLNIHAGWAHIQFYCLPWSSGVPMPDDE
jgi:hypothetical protein